MRRPRLSWRERNELWRRWQAGESYNTIAAALDRDATRVCRTIATEGGVAPVPRRRSRLALTEIEREEISRGLASEQSLRTIARRPKGCRLADRPRLRAVVAHKLACQWSPQQIAGWLRRTFPSDADMHVSHETIYRSLFVQSRGVLKRELLRHLRQRQRFRHARAATRQGHHRGRIPDAVSIRERPADVIDRAVPGHWEGDLLLGAGHQSQVATLVERQSRFVILVRLPEKTTQTVVRALAARVRRLPIALRKSLPWDRGTELTEHRAFTIATQVQVYFCDPHSPWQRGSNEHTNGLLRQYLPKGTDLSLYTQAQLDAIAHRLNTRPRLTLDFQTPADKLAEIVASTG